MKVSSVILLVFGLLSATVVDATTQSIFDVFAQQEVLEVTLETDFKLMTENIRNEEYQAAKWTYQTASGESVSWDMKVRQRGKYRRRVCDMPPLKLKFSKDDLAAEGLNDFNKLKLVTYCMDDPSSRANVLREYLAYKLYNELTPNSFRVQLLHLTYVDSADGSTQTAYGFVIESTKQLVERMGGEEVEFLNADPSVFHARQEALVAGFEYMIGNEDWSIKMLRNVKLVQPKDGSGIIPVPYDFDFAGLVGAPYAVPNRQHGLRTIKDRIYLGLVSNTNNQSTIKRYIYSKQDELYRVIRNFKLLNGIERTEMTVYLNTFFDNTSVEEEYPTQRYSR